MLFRVYHQNGKVKITKIMNHMEQVMTSDVSEGRMFEIEVGSSLWTKSHSTKIGKSMPALEESSVAEESAMDGLKNLEKSIQTLEFAKANGLIDRLGAEEAITILKNSVYGACAGK